MKGLTEQEHWTLNGSRNRGHTISTKRTELSEITRHSCGPRYFPPAEDSIVYRIRVYRVIDRNPNRTAKDLKCPCFLFSLKKGNKNVTSTNALVSKMSPTSPATPDWGSVG